MVHVFTPQYSKCVDQPQCVAENAICGGSGDHIMKVLRPRPHTAAAISPVMLVRMYVHAVSPRPRKDTACCNSTTDSCVPWGDDWKVCRKAGEETCAAHGEQCGGSGASSMKEKACCAAGDKCVVVNQYYSKCGEMGRESNHHALAATIQHAAQRERIPAGRSQLDERIPTGRSQLDERIPAGRSQLDERIPRISAPRSCALQTRQRRRGS